MVYLSSAGNKSSFSLRSVMYRHSVTLLNVLGLANFYWNNALARHSVFNTSVLVKFPLDTAEHNAAWAVFWKVWSLQWHNLPEWVQSRTCARGCLGLCFPSQKIHSSNTYFCVTAIKAHKGVMDGVWTGVTRISHSRCQLRSATTRHIQSVAMSKTVSPVLTTSIPACSGRSQIIYRAA